MGKIGYIALRNCTSYRDLLLSLLFILAARRKSPRMYQSARNGLIAVAGLVTIST